VKQEGRLDLIFRRRRRPRACGTGHDQPQGEKQESRDHSPDIFCACCAHKLRRIVSNGWMQRSDQGYR